jgi:transposase InsO family protein
MIRWLSVSEIAELLSVTRQRIHRRAGDEHWSYRTFDGNGGKQKRYHLADLPEDVQLAYAASLELPLRELQRQFEPALKTDKKVDIPRYHARAAKTDAPKAYQSVTEEYRRVAQLREKVIQAYSASGLTAEQFVKAYTNDMPVPGAPELPELRKQLGSYGNISTYQSLYRWLNQLAQHGVDGLAPQYSKRGGSGASLDVHTKQLIWVYYLHHNKPSVAHIIRVLKDKHQITLGEAVVYRYIKDEIPEATKAFFRIGEKYYHDHYDSYVNIDYTLLHAMQTVVYDHKMFDFAARVEKADGWHRVRLWLTCVIDKRSRKILGWCIDEVPSTLTIIRATRMMVENYGCPDSAQVDNGADFKSVWFAGNAWNEQHKKFGKKDKDAVSCVTGDLGMTVQFTEPYHGQSKNIERLFGFVSGEFDKAFDSYLGSNTADRPDRTRVYLGSFEGAPARPVEELPTKEEVRTLFERFALWYNSKWKHSGQGMDGKAPDTVFEETRRMRRDVAADYQQYVWTRRERRVVGRDGAVVDHERYCPQDNSLLIDLNLIGHEVEVRVSIDDLGTAYFFDLNGEYLCDAEGGAFKDSGITQENVNTVKLANKQRRKHIKRAESAMEEIKKDRKNQLEELRDKEVAEEEQVMFRVVGGEPLVIDTGNPAPRLTLVKMEPDKPKRRIRLPTDPD